MENLRAAFRFECRCRRCAAKGAFEKSDERLMRIRRLEDRLQDWTGSAVNYVGDDLGPPTTLMAEELVKLYREEGLDAHIGTAFGHAAMAYSAVAMRDKALEYVDLAIEALELKEGPGGGMDGTAMREMKEELENAEKMHWSWGSRLWL
jgi:hypothetical protein